MTIPGADSAIHNFLGAAQVFASAVEQAVENKLLEELAGGSITPSSSAC